MLFINFRYAAPIKAWFTCKLALVSQLRAGLVVRVELKLIGTRAEETAGFIIAGKLAAVGFRLTLVVVYNFGNLPSVAKFGQ